MLPISYVTLPNDTYSTFTTLPLPVDADDYSNRNGMSNSMMLDGLDDNNTG